MRVTLRVSGVTVWLRGAMEHPDPGLRSPGGQLLAVSSRLLSA